jgi:hypothetical protein
MTYGQIKLRLTQAFPGVSLDLIEGWVNDRYAEILPLSRLTVNTTLTTVIGQSVYPLPANCGILLDDALTNGYGTMQRFAHGQLNDGDPTRSQTGQPFSWASVMDDASTPPNMQIEVYPVPDAVYLLPLTYTAEAVPFGATSQLLQVWVQPSALIEGVTARIKAHLKDYKGVETHTALAAAALKNMRSSNAQGMGPAQMKLDPYYTRHRMKKFCR